MNTPPSIQDVERHIEQIAAFIETAERLIYQEKMVDIAALNDHINTLCHSLAQLPKNTARDLVDRLQTLFEAIERLEKDLNLQHDGLTQHLQFSDERANPLWAQEVRDDDEQ